MMLNIFRFDGPLPRRVASVTVPDLPVNQDLFARQHGGDFCEPDVESAVELLERLQTYTREKINERQHNPQPQG
jgi:hypothetical protein